MKRIFLILIFSSILLLLFFNIPEYNELNNISVIDKVTIRCKKNYYNVTLREVTLMRKDNGITFKYNYYKDNISDLNSLKNDYYNKYNRIFYYDKIKYVETNCKNIDILKTIFNDYFRVKKIKG